MPSLNQNGHSSAAPASTDLEAQQPPGSELESPSRMVLLVIRQTLPSFIISTTIMTGNLLVAQDLAAEDPNLLAPLATITSARTFFIITFASMNTIALNRQLSGAETPDQQNAILWRAISSACLFSVPAAVLTLSTSPFMRAIGASDFIVEESQRYFVTNLGNILLTLLSANFRRAILASDALRPIGVLVASEILRNTGVYLFMRFNVFHELDAYVQWPLSRVIFNIPFTILFAGILVQRNILSRPVLPEQLRAALINLRDFMWLGFRAGTGMLSQTLAIFGLTALMTRLANHERVMSAHETAELFARYPILLGVTFLQAGIFVVGRLRRENLTHLLPRYTQTLVAITSVASLLTIILYGTTAPNLVGLILPQGNGTDEEHQRFQLATRLTYETTLLQSTDLYVYLFTGILIGCREINTVLSVTLAGSATSLGLGALFMLAVFTSVDGAYLGRGISLLLQAIVMGRLAYYAINHDPREADTPASLLTRLGFRGTPEARLNDMPMATLEELPAEEDDGTLSIGSASTTVSDGESDEEDITDQRVDPQNKGLYNRSKH